VLRIPAEGERLANPRHYRTSEQALVQAHKLVSRRKKGRQRRTKARQLLAKQHQQGRRQRHDVHHQVALDVVRPDEALYLADLRVATRVGNRHLAKSISAAGWSSLCTTLAYKAAGAGKPVLWVTPASTSPDGSASGERVKKSRAVRTHGCPSGGCSADRDQQHAALNSLRAGQTRRGAEALVSPLQRASVGLYPRRSVNLQAIQHRAPLTVRNVKHVVGSGLAAALIGTCWGNTLTFFDVMCYASHRRMSMKGVAHAVWLNPPQCGGVR